MTAEMAISVQRGQVVNLPRSTEYAVQRGEVVNPATETIPARDKVFLFSAITRPGNSGGPIVAGDGRVIGLVVEDSSEAASSESGPDSAPFYRGIPSSEVIRALDDLGFGGIIKTEREPNELTLTLTFPNGERRFVDDMGDNGEEPAGMSDSE
jgi:S1-C subfamily serine protease